MLNLAIVEKAGNEDAVAAPEDAELLRRPLLHPRPLPLPLKELDTAARAPLLSLKRSQPALRAISLVIPVELVLS